MKTSNIALLTVGILTAGGLALNLWRSPAEHAAAPAENRVIDLNPPDGNRATRTLSPTQPQEPSERGSESEPTGDSIIAVPVSHEIESVFRMSPYAMSMHLKLEQQPRDPVWAGEMEEAYGKWIHGKSELARHGVRPEVDCRTSMCEVRLMAYGGGNSKELYDLLMKQPGTAPWPEGGIEAVADGNEQDGVTTVVIHTVFPRRGYTNE